MDKLAPSNRSTLGPFDESETVITPAHIDFGSLRLLADEGVSVRLEIEESTGKVVAITLELDGSLLQVTAFAAPRNEGLWAEVLEQLRMSIVSAGGSAADSIGSLGPVLVAMIPQPDGSTRNTRFIGVDGPRWFLRGTVSGAAMNDPVAAGRMEDLFRNIVVVRGDSPLPPREPLPLSVPAGTIPPPRPNF